MSTGCHHESPCSLSKWPFWVLYNGGIIPGLLLLEMGIFITDMLHECFWLNLFFFWHVSGATWSPRSTRAPSEPHSDKAKGNLGLFSKLPYHLPDCVGCVCHYSTLIWYAFMPPRLEGISLHLARMFKVAVTSQDILGHNSRIYTLIMTNFTQMSNRIKYWSDDILYPKLRRSILLWHHVLLTTVAEKNIRILGFFDCWCNQQLIFYS